MILAAADYANGVVTTPPMELQLVFDCQRWNALPAGGGVLDQPAGLLSSMGSCENVYHAYRAFIERDATRTAKWKQENKSAWELVKKVRELRDNGRE